MGTVLCWVCVGQATVGIVEQFGRYVGAINPGCHFVNCLIGKRLAGLVSLRIQQLDVKCETKTKDNVFVTIVCSVQYAALRQQVEDAFYKLTNPQQQIQAYVFDVVRASVPKLALDDVFEQKDDIAHNVRTELEKVMGLFGYSIQQTLITDIEPDALVKRSMNEINAAARLRLAANEKAEAEKILQVKRAEAEAEAKFLSGQGVARQRQVIVEGLRETVLSFSSQVAGTSAKDVLDIVLMTQYFDTMKGLGSNSKNTTVFMPSNPGSVADIATQLRNGFLQAEAGKSSDHQHHA